MNMKILLFVLLSSFIFLSSCNKQGESQVIGTVDHSDPTVSNTYSTIEESEIPSINVNSPVASSDVNEGISKAYAKAYFGVVEDLIDQYGFYVENEDGPMGFIRGDLIDFEDDGIPELVCIYRKEFFNNISIYQFVDNQAELLVDELSGNSIFGDNLSYIRYLEINGKPSILVQNCDWGRFERIKIFTMNDDELQTTELCADVQVLEESGPHVEHYLNCLINDKAVTEEEYLAQKETYEESDGIYWIYIRENNELRDYEQDDAIQFIKSLATDAGISEREVDLLLAE